MASIDASIHVAAGTVHCRLPDTASNAASDPRTGPSRGGFSTQFPPVNPFPSCGSWLRATRSLHSSSTGT